MQVLVNALSIHRTVYVPQKIPFLHIYRHSLHLMVLLPNKLGMDRTQVMLRVILIKQDRQK